MTPTQFTFSGQPTASQLAAAVRRVSRKNLRRLEYFGLGAAFLGVLLSWTGAFGPGIGLVVAGVVASFVGPRYLLAKAAKDSARLTGRPTTYQIDEEGLRSTSEVTESFVRWSLITGVDEVEGLLLACAAKNRFVPVPIEGLSAETAAQLRDFMRRHAGSAATVATGPAAEPVVEPVAEPEAPRPPQP